MSDPRPLHKLFGLTWIDFFQGSDVSVEIEIDLSHREQFLDVAIIRTGTGPLPRALPDGFDNLAPHNLVTFKSHQEPLDVWAFFELVGHFVNYRKQSSPSLQNLHPETDYQLFAVCVRFPRNLAQQVTLTPLRPGVYELAILTRRVRVIVVNELPQEAQNAMLHLFSTQMELLNYGREHYHPYSRDTSSLIYKLFQVYREDPTMPDKLKEFVRQTIDELLASLPPEERLKGVPAEELRKRLSPKQRVEGLSAEDLAQALSPEALEALIRQAKSNGSSPKVR